jgi:hypothetical protein
MFLEQHETLQIGMHAMSQRSGAAVIMIESCIFGDKT